MESSFERKTDSGKKVSALYFCNIDKDIKEVDKLAIYLILLIYEKYILIKLFRKAVRSNCIKKMMRHNVYKSMLEKRILC